MPKRRMACNNNTVADGARGLFAIPQTGFPYKIVKVFNFRSEPVCYLGSGYIRNTLVYGENHVSISSMRKIAGRFIMCMTFFMLLTAVAQESTLKPLKEGEIEPLLPMKSETKAGSAAPKVTSVYGITTEDYLPSVKELARKQLRPNVNSRGSRPHFHLPDAFYYIGGPIFLLLFLRVLVIFLNIFEEMRKEEQRKVASEVHKAEQT